MERAVVNHQAGPTGVHVLMLGTDPESRAGGIATALQGYRAALTSRSIAVTVIPSHRPGSFAGKWRPWIAALGSLLRRIRGARARGSQPVVYVHPGKWPSFPRKASLLLAGRLLGAPTVLQVHSIQYDTLLDRPLGRLALRTLFSLADEIAVPTPWWQARLRGAGIRRPLTVIPNPMPPELESVAREPTRRTPQPDGHEPFRVLALTRLLPGKGVDVTIRALKHLPRSVRLTVAGEGPERARLEALRDELELADRVRFAGWVSGDDKDRLLRQAALFCLPSTNDSFGMGFIEAMAYGLPVVAADWGPVSDVVAAGQTGVLVAPDDPEAVADAIRRLQEAPGIRERMGAAGRRRVLEYYSAAAVGLQLARSLRGLLPAELDRRDERLEGGEQT